MKKLLISTLVVTLVICMFNIVFAGNYIRISNSNLKIQNDIISWKIADAVKYDFCIIKR